MHPNAATVIKTKTVPNTSQEKSGFLVSDAIVPGVATG
jgi:hypothetical protein